MKMEVKETGLFRKWIFRLIQCSSDGKTGGIELKQRCLEVVMVLINQEPGCDVG